HHLTAIRSRTWQRVSLQETATINRQHSRNTVIQIRYRLEDALAIDLVIEICTVGMPERHAVDFKSMHGHRREIRCQIGDVDFASIKNAHGLAGVIAEIDQQIVLTCM